MADYSNFPFGDFSVAEVFALARESKDIGDVEFVQACMEAIRLNKCRPTTHALDLQPCGHPYSSIVMDMTEIEFYEPTPGELRVAVRVAGLNISDTPENWLEFCEKVSKQIKTHLTKRVAGVCANCETEHHELVSCPGTWSARK